MRNGADDAEGRTGAKRRAPGPRGPTTADPEAGFGLIEALIAAVILAVGLLAIAGIALGVASQTQSAAFTTDQDLAGQQVLEVTSVGGYAAVPTGTKDTTLTIGTDSVTVTRTVTQVAAGVKRVEVQVPGRGQRPPDTMMTYLHQPRMPPASP